MSTPPDQKPIEAMTLDEKTTAAEALLEIAAREYAPAVFASSFGAEDMVLTDLIAQRQPSIRIFTLDTGRLPEETHQLMRRPPGWSSGWV